MTNYKYIENLFDQVFASSNAIQGRFYIGWRYGLQDINYDTLGQVMDAIPKPIKYPLAMMAPPHSQTDHGGNNEGWEEFRIIMFFVKQSQIENIDPSTKTAQHTVLEDWHDMKRCSLNFLRVLRSVQSDMFGKVFQLPTHKVLHIPFSCIGADRVSGVRTDFDFRLFTGCNLEDYAEYPSQLIIDLDGHQEHALN